MADLTFQTRHTSAAPIHFAQLDPIAFGHRAPVDEIDLWAAFPDVTACAFRGVSLDRLLTVLATGPHRRLIPAANAEDS